jgi:hypothetical protein
MNKRNLIAVAITAGLFAATFLDAQGILEVSSLGETPTVSQSLGATSG